MKLNRNKPYMESHGPGSDCAFIQEGLKFNGHGDLMDGEIERKIEERKEVEESREIVETVEKAKIFCDFCGKVMKSEQGKKLHVKRWCKEKPSGRNIGKPDGQIKRNEPEIVAPGRNQTSIFIGRRNDS